MTLAPRFFTLLILLGLSCAVWSADTSPAARKPVPAASIDGVDALSSAAIVARRKRVEADDTLSGEQRKQLLAELDGAAAKLARADDTEAEIATLKRLIHDAPEQIRRLRDKASQTAGLKPEKVVSWDANRLENALRERQASLDEARTQLAQQEKTLAEYANIAKNGGAELADARKQLATLRAADPGTDATFAASVARLLRQARQRLLEKRIDWMALRQNNLDLLTGLAQARRDHLAARIKRIGREVDLLRKQLQARREKAVEAAQAAAIEASNEAPPVLKQVQERVAALVEEQGKLLDAEASSDRKAETIRRLLDELRNDRERITHALGIVGDSEEISALLLKHRRLIPSLTWLTQDVLRYQAEINDAVLRQLTLDEQLRDTADADAWIARLLAKTPVADEKTNALLRKNALRAWSDYRKAMLDLTKAYNRYVAKLSTLETNTRQLLDVAKDYREFIDEQLLWMPSTDPVPLAQPNVLFQGLDWLTDRTNLTHLREDARRVWRKRPLAVMSWILLVLIPLWSWRRACRALEASEAETRRVRTDRFTATLSALLATVVLILPLPMLLLGAGWLLASLRTADTFSVTTAAGLQGAGHLLLFLGALHQVTREHGLAPVHLRWRETLCRKLGGQAVWLIPLGAPLMFLISASAVQVPSSFIRLASPVELEEPGLLALGRLAFVVLMVLLSIAVYRIWGRKSPVFQETGPDSVGGRWAAYHFLWFPLVLLLPLGLAAAALAGYYYTALFLTSKVAETLWFVFALVVLRDLLYRSLYVTQRRLRFQEILQRREEMLAQRREAAKTGSVIPDDNEGLPTDDDAIDYGELSEQVRQLVRTAYTLGLLAGLWWLWKAVIPAFGFLDDVTLPITTAQLVDGVSKTVPLTLGDMLAGLLFGGLTLFAAKNTPGLLELTLLQRLPLSRATRYAITTLTQYVVAIIGVFITFTALGFQWSNVQWLVAALSVGLGFGLQEIVANFVSGVILLFEQPIRVGDVVTVNGTSGIVSRIRIRATTIQNWDRQELIIPNKSFITGELVNWSLSDTINRVIISVGVAYGSDTNLAMALMHEAANEHSRVLDEPPPRVTFEEFGDNALTLRLRAYLGELEGRLTVITELHQAIDEKFADAGLEISFPQRDVHLDTSRPLELVLRRDAKAAD